MNRCREPGSASVTAMKNRLLQDESGASLAEYVMLLALIACACITAVGNTGGTVRKKFGVDFAGAIYRPASTTPVVVTEPPGNTGSGSDASGDDGALSGNDDGSGHKTEKEKHVHPHDNGKGSDDGKIDDK